jgi:hypothetical protein
MWRGWAFLLRGVLLVLWVTTVNPGILFCYVAQEEVLVISDFMQQLSPINVYCCCCFFCSSVSTEAQTLWTHALCSSSSLGFTAMFHLRDLTCQQSMRWDYVILHLYFCRLSQWFPLCRLWRDDLCSHSLQMKFPHV